MNAAGHQRYLDAGTFGCKWNEWPICRQLSLVTCQKMQTLLVDMFERLKDVPA